MECDTWFEFVVSANVADCGELYTVFVRRDILVRGHLVRITRTWMCRRSFYRARRGVGNASIKAVRYTHFVLTGC